MPFEPPPFKPGMVGREPGRPFQFAPGDIIRFSYEHQDVDAHTGDRDKEVLVLHPFWNNKLHGIDLKRLNRMQREVLEALLDPELKDRPHRIPLVNQIKRRYAHLGGPLEMVGNPVVFYTRVIKPLLRQVDAYRQYIPRKMSAITRIRDAKIGTGKPPIDKPMFGAKKLPPPGQPQPVGQKPLTPIDIMKQAQRISPTAARGVMAKFGKDRNK